MKTCSKCHESLPLNSFAPRKDSKDGRRGSCQNCRSQTYAKWRAANIDTKHEKDAAYRAANKDAERARWARWVESNRDAYLTYQSRHRQNAPHVYWRGSYCERAVKFGHEPIVEDFTKPDVIDRYGDSCFYCEVGAFEELDYEPISKGGLHTLANVRPSCTSCNRSKHSTHGEEFIPLNP